MTVPYENLGRDRHVAYPCDEEDDTGRLVRTWDVFRRGRCVGSGFRTRAEARLEAERLDAAEADRGAS